MRPSTVFALAWQAAGAWRTLIASAPAASPARAAHARTLYDAFQPAFAAVTALTADALRDAMAQADGPVLVDVRSLAERRVSTLAGAVPAQEFMVNGDAWRGRPIVAFCTLGVRSGAWAAERHADGLTVVNLEGGLLAWTHARGALVTPDGAPTRRLHVYGAPWNLVHEDYEGVW